jgi:hypothetical protein
VDQVTTHTSIPSSTLSVGEQLFSQRNLGKAIDGEALETVLESHDVDDITIVIKDFVKAWQLVSNLEIVADLGIIDAVELNDVETTDNLDIASQLCYSDAHQYWIYLQLNPSELPELKRRIAWRMLRLSQSEEIQSELEDLGAVDANDLEVIDEDTLNSICKNLSHVEMNMFLECFGRFQCPQIDIDSTLNIFRGYQPSLGKGFMNALGINDDNVFVM